MKVRRGRVGAEEMRRELDEGIRKKKKKKEEKRQESMERRFWGGRGGKG